MLLILMLFAGYLCAQSEVILTVGKVQILKEQSNSSDFYINGQKQSGTHDCYRVGKKILMRVFQTDIPERKIVAIDVDRLDKCKNCNKNLYNKLIKIVRDLLKDNDKDLYYIFSCGLLKLCSLNNKGEIILYNSESAHIEIIFDIFDPDYTIRCVNVVELNQFNLKNDCDRFDTVVFGNNNNKIGLEFCDDGRYYISKLKYVRKTHNKYLKRKCMENIDSSFDAIITFIKDSKDVCETILKRKDVIIRCKDDSNISLHALAQEYIDFYTNWIKIVYSKVKEKIDSRSSKTSKIESKERTYSVSSSATPKIESKGFVRNIFEKIKSGVFNVFAAFNSFFKKIFALFYFKK